MYVITFCLDEKVVYNVLRVQSVSEKEVSSLL